jgi:hypothetical protein
VYIITMIKTNLNKKGSEMKLIGGQKLKDLGSTRHTEDSDYLISDSSRDLFSHDAENNVDYINAAKNDFFGKIWNKEIENSEISLNSLLELKAYSFVQHCQNFNFVKADADEFDIKFLIRKLGFDVNFKIVQKHISTGEMSEVINIINSMKK